MRSRRRPMVPSISLSAFARPCRRSLADTAYCQFASRRFNTGVISSQYHDVSFTLATSPHKGSAMRGCEDPRISRSLSSGARSGDPLAHPGYACYLVPAWLCVLHVTTWCFPSNGQCGDAVREGGQLIDGPLVVGVDAVLHRVDPSGRRDQEVGRQPRGAAPSESQTEMTVRHTAHPGPQGLEAHEAERTFDPEVLVKG